MHLGLTWDWQSDLIREINKSQSKDLEEIAEQLSPFTHNFLHNVITILRDDDIK